MQIDAHQHFWVYDQLDYDWMDDSMGAIRRNFLPAELKPLLEQSGFEGSVLVQARQTLDDALALSWPKPILSFSEWWAGSMRHRPTDCQLQAAGESVKQLDNKLVVWRTSSMVIQQPKDSRYVKNAGAVFNLSYHIVFCPKYRHKVLVGDVETRLKHILYATAQQYGVLIETMEVMPDHVHLFVTSDPTRCVAEIVRQEFRHLVSKMPTLWSRSYYAGTVGHVSESTVKKYIENQKGR